MLAIKRVVLILLLTVTNSLFAEESALSLIRRAVDHWRGESSYLEATMLVHRPTWERTMSFKGWTEGEKKSLVRFTSPAKDAGNSSLVIDREMWSYSPKINRIVKIPSSMMNQSWMGSDFSHSDLAKQTDIIDQYTHKVIGDEKHEGHKVTVIESIPKDDAAVVWGKEVLKVRDDLVIIERAFYDQDMKLVKKLSAYEIMLIGGRTYPKRSRMQSAESSDEWTEIVHEALNFGISLDSKIFSLSHLSDTRN